jgi:hypothetical protein
MEAKTATPNTNLLDHKALKPPCLGIVDILKDLLVEMEFDLSDVQC